EAGAFRRPCRSRGRIRSRRTGAFAALRLCRSGDAGPAHPAGGDRDGRLAHASSMLLGRLETIKAACAERWTEPPTCGFVSGAPHGPPRKREAEKRGLTWATLKKRRRPSNG